VSAAVRHAPRGPVLRRRVGRVVSYVVLVLLALIGIAPFAFMLLLSTKSSLEILDVPPSLHIDWSVARENYRVAIEDNSFFTYIKSSIIVTGCSTAIALVLGVPAGYAFSRLRFRGRERWASTILSFRFMPPVAVAIPIALMIRYLGQINTYPGLVLPYVAFSLPLVVWMMMGFFDEVPREIDEAALVDGCSRPAILARVMLPLVRPGMVVAAIFSVIFIWNEFLVGLYVISSPDHFTVPIAASALLTTESPIDFNTAAAVGVLTVIPILLFSIFVQRYIVRGMTAGAVK
jgi:multiple sugar transport system permease protein